MSDQTAILNLLRTFPGSTSLSSEEAHALFTEMKHADEYEAWRSWNAALPPADLSKVPTVREPRRRPKWVAA